jgi:heme-degrading monooxygenase HmoA
VIARIWKARATPERVREYAAYLKATVVPELTAIAGYEGVSLLQRDSNGTVEVTVITWWHSLEAIRAFAGEAIETAVVHDSAARMLIDFDRRVEHHEVIFHGGPAAES